MSKKIVGVTVGTTLSPSAIERKLKPVKTVNGVAPDENGNVKIEYTKEDKAEMVNDVLAALPKWEGGMY